MLSRIKIICQKVNTEKFKDLAGKISIPGVIAPYLAMSYFMPFSEFKVHK